jgi:hypothetical protein
MQTKAIFRGLLILQIFIFVAGILAVHTGMRSLPSGLQNYVDSNGAQLDSDQPAAFTIFKAGFTLYLLLFIVSLVGLFLFWPPARVLYLICAGSGPLLDLTNSVHILPMWASLWHTLGHILMGIILCMMFTPPCREQFAITNKTALAHDDAA